MDKISRFSPKLRCMRFFENKLSIGILFVSIPLLFLPKINLLNISSTESAGLRVDDIILFFIGTLFMFSHVLSHQKLYKVEGWILLITFFSCISFLSNRLLVAFDLLYLNAKIFYALRLMEYFIFFYIGALTSQYFDGSKIIRAFFLWNFFIMTLQKLQLLGAVTVEGYSGHVSARVFGVASFPSEMGLILNLLFCYMVWDTSASSKFIQLFRSEFVRNILRSFYLYWMFILFGIFIIFTGNRISIVALFVCFFCRLMQTFKLRSVGSLMLIMIFIPALFIGIGFLIRYAEGIYERSAGLFSVKNFELFYSVWDHIDIKTDPMSNLEEGVYAEGYDMSWWMRIHKWLFAAKSYLSNPECYLQGLGPGFAQSALDGGLLRILIEYGLIGVFLFWKFFSCLYRINSQTKWMIIAFLMNMIFFDAYLAYKTMSFLLFACGYLFEKQHCLAHESMKRLKYESSLYSVIS